MVKKITIIMMTCMFILLLSMVQATHILNFDNYMDVNETSTINLIQTNGLNETAMIAIGNELIIMNKTASNSHLVYIISTKEEDVPFFINVFRSNQTYFNETFGDDSRESYIEISDDSYHYVSKTHNNSVIKEDYENSLLCPSMYAYKGNPILKGFVAINVSGNLTYYYGSEVEITSNNYESQCINVEFQYPQNMSNFTNYYGAYCTNCDVLNKIRGEVDTNSTNQNRSFTSINSTEPLIIYPNNFMGTFLYLRTPLFESFSDILKFRIPFYLNISLQELDTNSTFNTAFNYIVLEENTQSLTSLEDTGTAISDSFDLLTKIITLGPVTGLGAESVDYDEVFWCTLENYNCKVKLYEKNNFSITLLTMKTFKDGWEYEFIKPQYTTSKVETTLDSELRLTEETNTSIKILMSEYESNKAGYVFNIVKVVIAIIILFGGSYFLIVSGNAKAIGVLIPFWLILIKLLNII